MDARCSKLRFGKQMLISRNAKCGWRRQCMNSEIGWIAYAHICLASCISCARLDLVYSLSDRRLWVLLVKYCQYRKLFTNERAHQPLLDSRTKRPADKRCRCFARARICDGNFQFLFNNCLVSVLWNTLDNSLISCKNVHHFKKCYTNRLLNSYVLESQTILPT